MEKRRTVDTAAMMKFSQLRLGVAIAKKRELREAIGLPTAKPAPREASESKELAS